MAYSRVNWVDNVTPLDQVHLNQMDSYIKTLDDAVTADAATTGAKVDKDSVVAAATRIVASKLVGGDAQPAFQINGDGKLAWGQGGSTAPDTTLKRFAASFLQASGLVIDTALYVDHDGSGYKLLFGSAADTSLYRAAAGDLKTDGRLLSAKDIYAQVNGSYTGIGLLGPGGQPALILTADTSLYRAAAGVLQTDSQFSFAGNPSGTAPLGLVSSTSLPLHVQGAAGSGYSAVLGHNVWLRASDGLLVHDTTHGSFGSRAIVMDFTTGIRFHADASAATAGAAAAAPLRMTVRNDGNVQIYNKAVFGSAADVNIYRDPNGPLKTDGEMVFGGGKLYLRGTGTSIIYFGTADDAYIYRVSAGTLRTDGVFQCSFPAFSARTLEVGVPDSGGSGFRMVRVAN